MSPTIDVQVQPDLTKLSEFVHGLADYIDSYMNELTESNATHQENQDTQHEQQSE